MTRSLIWRLKRSRTLWFSPLLFRSIWIRSSHLGLWALKKLLSIVKISTRTITEVRDRWCSKKSTVFALRPLSKESKLKANHPSESFNLIKKGVKLSNFRIHWRTKCNLIGRELSATKNVITLRRLFVPRQNIQNLGYIKILNASKILILNRRATACRRSQIS